MRRFLECKPDEALAVALGVPGRSIVHCHGKGRVSRNLQRHSGVTGLVDEDIGSVEPATLTRYLEVSVQHDLKLKEDSNQGNRLVVVCPRLEDWIIKTAKASDLKMEDFNLSELPNALRADINYRLPNLKRLLNRLLELESPRLLHMKALLAGG